VKELYTKGKQLFVALLSALLIINQLGILSPIAVHGAEGDGTAYEETNTLEAGKKYILAVTKDDGSVYAIKNGGTTNGASTVELDVTATSTDKPASITTDDTTVVWEYTSNQYLTNNGQYFYPSSSQMRIYTSGRAIAYADGKLSFIPSSKITTYITCSNGTLATSEDVADAATFRLFVKTDEDPVEPPIEPPTGDVTVEITPTSSNSPVESAEINVGGTLVIKVTNGSSSEYTYTATLSNNDAAKIQGEASLPLAGKR